MTKQNKQAESFDRMANDWTFWDWSAKQLIASSDILRRERNKKMKEVHEFPYACPPEFYTEEIEWMLKAFAIECLLKGLIVRREKIIAENGTMKREITKLNHDLKKLADRAFKDIPPQYPEEALIHLSQISFLGRYPVRRHQEGKEFSDEQNAIGYDYSWVKLTANEEISIDKFLDETVKKLNSNLFNA